MRHHVLIALTAIALAPAIPQTPAPALDGPTAAAVERAGKYVDAFESEFALVVCEERQTQRVIKADGKIARQRDIRSEVALVKVGTTWPQPFRDVIEVDGKPVRNRDDRLRKLFVESPKTAVAQSQAIAQESRRFNIGVPRTGASPVHLLRILHPRLSPGFHFALHGTSLEFDEFHTPSLLQYHRGSVHRDLPAHGTFTIDPVSGRVAAVELTAGPPAPVSTSMTVRYSEDPLLKALVPVEMHERYWDTGKPKNDQTDVQSTYSNFRRFQVRIDAHPLDGTWKLNVAKSTYDPPTLAPKSGTQVYRVTGDTLEGANDGVDAQGRPTHSEYTVKFDGEDYPWKGTIAGQPNTSQDTVSFRRIDDRTFEILNKLKGKVVVTQRTVVAADGMSRTTTTVGTNAQGQKINNVTVLEKVPSR